MFLKMDTTIPSKLAFTLSINNALFYLFLILIKVIYSINTNMQSYCIHCTIVQFVLYKLLRSTLSIAMQRSLSLSSLWYTRYI